MCQLAYIPPTTPHFVFFPLFTYYLTTSISKSGTLSLCYSHSSPRTVSKASCDPSSPSIKPLSLASVPLILPRSHVYPLESSNTLLHPNCPIPHRCWLPDSHLLFRHSSWLVDLDRWPSRRRRHSFHLHLRSHLT